MEVKYVLFKGIKYPFFNTPLTNSEFYELRDKYDKFLIHNVTSNKINLYSNDYQLNRFVFDLGFRPMVYITGIALVCYYYFSFKKKIKKIMPFSFNKDIKEFIKDFDKPTNGTKPIQL